MPEMTGRARAAVIDRPTPRGMVAIRAAAADLAVAAAALGLPDPAQRRAEAAGPRALLWMSPDERLLICERWDAARLAAELAAALAGRPHLAADVSDLRVAFRLTGPGARDALAKGAPIDLAPRGFGPGDVRRTHFGQTAALIRMVSAGPDVFELLCLRSVADHVARMLDAATTPGRAPAVF